MARLSSPALLSRKRFDNSLHCLLFQFCTFDTLIASAVRNTPAITICFGSWPRSRISRTTLPTTRHISRYKSSSFVWLPILFAHRKVKQKAYITLLIKTKIIKNQTNKTRYYCKTINNQLKHYRLLRNVTCLTRVSVCWAEIKELLADIINLPGSVLKHRFHFPFLLFSAYNARQLSLEWFQPLVQSYSATKNDSFLLGWNASTHSSARYIEVTYP